MNGGTKNMVLQESGEMYLETIYYLSKRKPSVRAIDVGEHLGYSKPSVSRALSILKANGYVSVADHGSLVLSDIGLEIAQKIYSRHLILSAFLERIGVDKEIAAEDACKMEHAISDETLAAIKAHLGNI